MRKFANYEVTEIARDLAVRVYHLLPCYPVDERFALCRQIRRAVVSIGANIAEGAGRSTDKDFAHFLSQAIGSACELEFLMLLSADLGYLEKSLQTTIDNDIQLIKAKLYRLRQALLVNPKR